MPGWKMVTPMFSVLTRTSGRPRFFEHCRRSVLMQQEPVFHLVYCDNAADDLTYIAVG